MLFKELEVICINYNKITRTEFSRLGMGLTLFMLVPQIIAAAVSIIVGLVKPTMMNEGWYLWVLSYIPLYFAGFPILCVLWSDVPNRQYNMQCQKQKLSAKSILLILSICMAVAYALNLVSLGLMEIVSIFKGSSVENPLESMLEGSGVWISALILIIVAPIMEEIIFRGILYKKLIPYGAKVYIVFSSFVFALFHGNLFQIPYAFALGAIFAYITVITGTIKYSIILHMAINALGGGISNILSSLQNDSLLNIFSIIVLAIVIVGVVNIVKMVLSRYKIKVQQDIETERGIISIGSNQNVYANVGMILYISLMAIIVISSIFVM